MKTSKDTPTDNGSAGMEIPLNVHPSASRLDRFKERQKLPALDHLSENESKFQLLPPASTLEFTDFYHL
jgi:hypothetical protein